MGIREKFGMESAKGAEVMVEEKFPIVRELDLSAPEIKWLNGVLTYCKKCDDEEEEREVQRYEGQSIGEIIKEKRSFTSIECKN